LHKKQAERKERTLHQSPLNRSLIVVEEGASSRVGSSVGIQLLLKGHVSYTAAKTRKCTQISHSAALHSRYVAGLFLLAFHTTSNRCPALVRVAEPIALTSIFPYAWKLVLHYEVGNENDAAFYAGILIAAFSLAEALTGMFWGSLSDRIGRKKVLLFGNAGTLLSMLIVGFAPSFGVALMGRILGGLLNGNIGVIQASNLVSEYTYDGRLIGLDYGWRTGD
jgi:MFS family permease